MPCDDRSFSSDLGNNPRDSTGTSGQLFDADIEDRLRHCVDQTADTVQNWNDSDESVRYSCTLKELRKNIHTQIVFYRSHSQTSDNINIIHFLKELRSTRYFSPVTGVFIRLRSLTIVYSL